MQEPNCIKKGSPSHARLGQHKGFNQTQIRKGAERGPSLRFCKKDYQQIRGLEAEEKKMINIVEVCGKSLVYHCSCPRPDQGRSHALLQNDSEFWICFLPQFSIVFTNKPLGRGLPSTVGSIRPSEPLITRVLFIASM
ncbi:hypothetical protein E2C01_097560 [Portunus trituberculatus]|uniref:Uncharacterized protein n=1 Tax=Portunus trituberculatus TaxID=210409 RepID=A0A5B7K554_PORTR|nr:hypothetical protein [Portunus trituberculatus]